MQIKLILNIQASFVTKFAKIFSFLKFSTDKFHSIHHLLMFEISFHTFLMISNRLYCNQFFSLKITVFMSLYLIFFRDFIRSLPVHIAKYILGYLDIASLHNALCVSTNWRTLVEEVHNEFRVNQDLIEEVMLMQVCHTYVLKTFRHLSM